MTIRLLETSEGLLLLETFGIIPRRRLHLLAAVENTMITGVEHLPCLKESDTCHHPQTSEAVIHRLLIPVTVDIADLHLRRLPLAFTIDMTAGQ